MKYMSKFDNIRKIIKTHKKRIHIVYSVIFLLVLMFVGLYIQNYKINTKNEMNYTLSKE